MTVGETYTGEKTLNPHTQKKSFAFFSSKNIFQGNLIIRFFLGRYEIFFLLVQGGTIYGSSYSPIFLRLQVWVYL